MQAVIIIIAFIFLLCILYCLALVYTPYTTVHCLVPGRCVCVSSSTGWWWWCRREEQSVLKWKVVVYFCFHPAPVCQAAGCHSVSTAHSQWALCTGRWRSRDGRVQSVQCKAFLAQCTYLIEHCFTGALYDSYITCRQQCSLMRWSCTCTCTSHSVSDNNYVQYNVDY